MLMWTSSAHLFPMNTHCRPLLCIYTWLTAWLNRNRSTYLVTQLIFIPVMFPATGLGLNLPKEATKLGCTNWILSWTGWTQRSSSLGSCDAVDATPMTRLVDYGVTWKPRPMHQRPLPVSNSPLSLETSAAVTSASCISDAIITEKVCVLVPVPGFEPWRWSVAGLELVWSLWWDVGDFVHHM